MDFYTSEGRVKQRLTFRKAATKGKLATRTIPVAAALRPLLEQYYPLAGKGYLFPGRWRRGHIHSDSADKLLREACERVGLAGVSTHSFRRTALTRMSSASIPLRVIQEISGHKTLSALQRYLEVREEEVERAISALVFSTDTELRAVEKVGR
jgi:integrase/recombinase XerD